MQNDNQPVSLMKRMILEEINTDETCGWQTDWSGWEALYAMQMRFGEEEEEEEAELMMDDNGNISPVPVINSSEVVQHKSNSSANVVSNLPSDKPASVISLPDNKNSQNQLNLESPTDLEMSNKFFHASLFESTEDEPKLLEMPVFEMNEKYLVEEKDRACSARKYAETNENEKSVDCDKEDCLSEEREALKNMRNSMIKSDAFPPCSDNIFNIKNHTAPDQSVLSENKAMIHHKPDEMIEIKDYTSIISYDSEEDDARNVRDFNQKNNALNSKNERNDSVDEIYKIRDIKQNYLDIFSLRDQPSNQISEKERKHDVAREIAFKEEFNLRQKMNSGSQVHNIYENQCTDFDMTCENNLNLNIQNNHCQNKNKKYQGNARPATRDQDINDLLGISPSIVPFNRNNHHTNEKLRKNLLSQKLSHHSHIENGYLCEDGFLGNHDSACSVQEPTSPRSGSMDWILFSANSDLQFPPLQVPTSQRITEEGCDNIQGNHTVVNPNLSDEFSSRAHPSGAKPKKFTRKKTKAL